MRRSLLVALALFPTAALAAEPQWELLSEDDGISVWQREVPGTSFVEFRGRGRIDAPLQRVLAVIRNQTHKTDWMADLTENTPLESWVDRYIVYNRFGSPVFFVSDRDVILDAKATWDERKRAVTVSFREVSHPKRPPTDAAVRMPKVRGFWLLEHEDARSTRVTYQVQADPGGALPAWLVNASSQDMPYFTLKALREQVKRPEYDEDLAAVERAFDWSALDGSKRSATATVARP